MAERLTTSDPLAELVLIKHLFHEDADVREAASKALSVLTPAKAQRWLTRRLGEESDLDVRRTIEETLDLMRVAHE